jgi:hypothetical protein
MISPLVGHLVIEFQKAAMTCTSHAANLNP